MGVWTVADLRRMAQREACSFTTALRKFFIQFAWPGGYPLVYGTTRGGDVLCHKHAVRQFLTDGEIAVGTHDEGPSLFCDECGAEIESAYGDPDAENGDEDA